MDDNAVRMRYLTEEVHRVSPARRAPTATGVEADATLRHPPAPEYAREEALEMSGHAVYRRARPSSRHPVPAAQHCRVDGGTERPEPRVARRGADEGTPIEQGCATRLARVIGRRTPCDPDSAAWRNGGADDDVRQEIEKHEAQDARRRQRSARWD